MRTLATILIGALSLAAVAVVDGAQGPVRQPTLLTPTLIRTYEGAPGAEFNDVVGATIDREGRAIWIRERRDALVRRIDRANALVRIVGQTGDGPLEFRRPVALAAHARRGIVIFDGQHRRLTHIDPSGAPRQILGSLAGQYLGGGNRLWSDTVGRFYGQARSSHLVTEERDGLGGKPIQLLVDGSIMPVALRVPSLRAQNVWYGTHPGGRVTWVTIPGPEWLHAVLADGRVASAWTDSNVVWISDGSRPTVRLSFAAVRERKSSETLARETAARRRFDATIRRDRLSMSGPRPPSTPYKPQLAGLASRVDGGVALIRWPYCVNVPDWRDPLRGGPAPPTQVDCPVLERFDSRGRREATVSLPRAVDSQLLGVRGDTIWLTMPYLEGDPDLEGFSRVGEFVVKH